MDGDHHVARLLYFVMAAIAGAVTALAFMKWKEMTAAEIVLTLTTGASFAIFVTPWIAATVFKTDDPASVAALAYISASGSNSLIPMLIRWLSRAVGQEKRDA